MAKVREKDIHEQLISTHTSKVGNYYLFPILLAAIPFVPLVVVIAAAVGAGLMVAKSNNALKILTKPKETDSQYSELDLSDGEIVKHLYLGHGMDVLDYKEGLDQLENKQGIVSPDDKRAYWEDLCRNSLKPIYLHDDLATRHALLVGATGSGKTETFQTLAYQAIKRGSGCVIFDAKGDEGLLTRVYYMAQLFGRIKDLQVVTFERPEISHTYNPLIGGGTRQMISTMMRLLDDDGEQFFRDMSKQALSAAVVCLQNQPIFKPFNFVDLSVLFSDLDAFWELYEEIPRQNVDAREFVYSFLSQWMKVDRQTGEKVRDLERYATILAGLKSVMMSFSHDAYRQILNSYNPDIELKESIQTNKILILTVPALSDKEGVRTFGQLFLADLSRAIGEIQQERSKPLNAVPVILDEYGSYCHNSQVELYQQARSAGISLMPSIQGRSFLVQDSEEFAASVMGNCWTHIYLDTRDPATREEAIKLAGNVIRRMEQSSYGKNEGDSYRNADTGAVRGMSVGTSESIGFKETREELLQPEDFSQSPGDALLIGKSGVSKMRMPLVKFDEDQVPTLDQIQLPRYDKPRVEGVNLAARISAGQKK